MKNQTVIPASAFVVMTMGVLSSVERSQSLPGIAFWIGIAIAYMFISLVAEFNGELASGFAILLLFSALLATGEDVASFVGNRTGGKIGTQKTQTHSKRPGTIVTQGAPVRYV